MNWPGSAVTLLVTALAAESACMWHAETGHKWQFLSWLHQWWRTSLVIGLSDSQGWRDRCTCFCSQYKQRLTRAFRTPATHSLPFTFLFPQDAIAPTAPAFTDWKKLRRQWCYYMRVVSVLQQYMRVTRGQKNKRVRYTHVNADLLLWAPAFVF